MTSHAAITSRDRQIFEALDLDNSGSVSTAYLINFLKNNGLHSDDRRLRDFFSFLQSIDGVANNKQITLQQFCDAISSCSTLIHKCVTGDLVVPDFKTLTEIIEEVYKQVEPNKGGNNADYIPQLAAVDPEQFAISITTIDGQHFSIGDHDKQFCIRKFLYPCKYTFIFLAYALLFLTVHILEHLFVPWTESCSKPISYIIALNEFGEEYVHKYVGTEPSGLPFNAMALKSAPTPDNSNRAVPHNPCINAGAILSCSMVFPGIEAREERLKRVINYWKELSGGLDAPIGYDEATYKSESATADRNWCLGYMMRERKSWPPCFSYEGTKSLSDTLELYFQICSILSTSKCMSITAATMANGGLNPISGHRVCTPQSIRHALPLMLTCGMYDYSGQWAFDVGVPAKSGVGGCVYMVIPNVCGIAVWSPRLDDIGNSTRGVAVARELVKRVKLNAFEVFSGLNTKKLIITTRKHSEEQKEIGELLYAASEGDVAALESQANAGTNIFEGDYDLRTAMHLAATEGQVNALEFLIQHAKKCDNTSAINAKDRWGGTPLSDAVANNNLQCVEVLKNAGATEGSSEHYKSVSKEALNTDNVSDTAPQILFAAAEGDLNTLVRCHSRGLDLHAADYDHRTALHLAASNGHLDCIKYLMARAKGSESIINAKDRFGNTPKDDTIRENHSECTKLF